MDSRYKTGLKYSLIFIEPKTNKRVLMDNHHPKTPHVHLDTIEFNYEYVDIKTLIKDFRNFVFKHFGEKI